MLANQWQHHVRTVSLRPLFNAEYKAGPAASAVFQVSVVT